MELVLNNPKSDLFPLFPQHIEFGFLLINVFVDDFCLEDFFKVLFLVEFVALGDSDYEVEEIWVLRILINIIIFLEPVRRG